MIDYRHRIPVDWPQVLERALERARGKGPKGLLVFDLDSTLFDNRPRQARILREFGEQRGVEALRQCQAYHFVSGWDLKAATVACGVAPGEAEALYRELKAFWAGVFFTSEYCRDDIETVGSPRFLAACRKTGAHIVYVTGRHEEMREGTVACLSKCDMPVPGELVTLMMKPRLEESDDEYKRVSHQALESMGEVVAAFDNEPTHVADYAQRFPGALAVHLATDNSGREVPLSDAIVSIPHFAW